jgi:hypothetical protein
VHRSLRAAAGTTAAVLALAACGGPAPAATPAPTTDPAAAQAAATADFCRSVVDIESTLNSAPPVDPSTLPPEEAQAVLAEQLAAVDPLLTRAEELAPEAVAADVTTLARLTRQSLGGDFSVFEDPAFASSEAAVDEWMLAECGYEQTEVTASDFEYQGLPDALPAGVSAVTLTNEGEELHEIAMVRIKDEVTMSVEELLALPQEEVLGMVDIAGIVFAAPGETGTSFVEGTPGRYFAACFIPEGTVGGAEGSGPPHFTLGMLAEYSVA